ncbi:phage tail protein [Pluralibacter sp.]|uniref:phage tail protein n=1 Tax=Pluralibacter sp. TaxID=1920032 RepID=UPI0025D113F0|nr:phage tail protein [Pluralibacter sp.]MBV8042104.1 phage tail protein [Pluralibacter sp.]
MSQDLYAPSLLEPSLANHFRVTFFFKNLAGYLSFPISLVVDAAFQNISGLSRELGVDPLSEGGENCRNNYLATKVRHGSLVLERGVMTVTPMAAQFEHMMRNGTPVYCNVFIHLITTNRLRPDLRGEQRVAANWGISNALPVSWKTDTFDASSSKVLINTIELRYQEMFWLGVKV